MADSDVVSEQTRVRVDGASLARAGAVRAQAASMQEPEEQERW
jgi:hypothetical protein